MTLAPSRHADYGQRWGEGAARCFSIEGDFLDDAQGLRLMPVPDSFFCPISAAIMNDPVATVDGCAYEREYIERWFRERRQFRQPITSPTTGLELQSTTLMPLVALQRAIEAYLLHRPELKRDHLAGRSFEEAAQVLQVDLLEKQAMNASVHDELYRLREANRALKRALQGAESACQKAMQDLERTKMRVQQLESEKSAGTQSLPESGSAISEDSGCTAAVNTGGSQQTAPKSDLASAQRKRLAEHVTNPPPAPAVKPQQLEPKVDTTKPKSKDLDSLHAKGYAQHFLQGILLLVVIALCLFLYVRDQAALKVPLDGRGLEHGSGDSSISRQIEQLHSGSADERMGAAMELQKIAGGGDKHRAAVIDAGAPQRLVKLLEDDVVQVQKAGAYTLASLASGGSASQAAVVTAGAISPLVQLLKAGDVDAAPKAAAVALRQLAAGSEKNQVIITTAGAIAPLVEILRSDVPSARLEAAVTLRQLAGDGLKETRYSKQVAIAQAGAILPLVRLIRDEVPGARQAAAGTLRILATNNADNQVAIAQAGAISPLVVLLSDAEPGARQEAAAALDRLAVFEMEANFGNQVAIGQAGAIAELAKLLQDEVIEVAFTAAGALRSLVAANADNLDRALQAVSISNLVALLKRGKVVVPAISLLRSLASSSPTSQEAIVEAGGIAPLVELLKNEASQIRGEAAGALVSLARGNQDIQAAVLEAGVSSDLLKGERQ